MVNFVKTANEVNMLTNNECPMDVQVIADFFDFDLKDEVKEKATELKAYWVIGWEDEDEDGVWYGTALVTFKGQPVGTLTISKEGSSVEWMKLDYDFAVFDYLVDLIQNT